MAERKITAAKLAEFMNISPRALKKLDKDGELTAYRKNGRRLYTSKHIMEAIEMMGGDGRKTIKINFCKNGVSSMFGKAPIPLKWLRSIGITPDDPEATLIFDGERLTITKDKKED